MKGSLAEPCRFGGLMGFLRSLALLLAAALLGSALQAQPAFLVKDIAAAPGAPYWPYGLQWVSLGDLAVFATYDPVHGVELWKSDGTAAGTRLLADICPGVCPSQPAPLTVVGSTVFFGADDGVHGRALWKSDGTAEGTILVREISP